MIPIEIKQDTREVLNNNIRDLEIKDLGGIEIVLIGGIADRDYEVWKKMMEERHYLKSSKVYGQRINYLIRSKRYGWIGGISFSSSAWKLKSRDKLIRCDKEGEKVGIEKIICNNRFLILPEYGVRNLATYVMSRCLKRVAGDWEKRYGVRPVLVETFVEKDRFKGTCYKAGNWRLIGETEGRGRDDRHHEFGLKRKYIFVYELKAGVLEKGKGKKAALDWVEEEYEYTEMMNKAKKKRLISLTRDFYAKPSSGIPISCVGEAKLRGAYRFFGDNRVKPEDILESHIKRSIERAREHKVVLAINDTVIFNLSGHKATKGLGCISSEATEAGYLLHDTVLFTPERVPLGVIGAKTWSRDVAGHGRKEKRRQRPIEEKESWKWIDSLKKVAEIKEAASDTEFVHIGDREADIYELFEIADGLCSYIVRSSQNRLTVEGEKVWDLVSCEKASGQIKVKIRGEKKKNRVAELEIRYKGVTLVPPENKPECVPIKVWSIIAKEINTPQGEKPIEWRLFTNIGIDSFEAACEKVEWYSVRFCIETYHRILKSGRRTEDKRLNSLERLERCLAIDMITAWRLMYLTMLGRETPEIDADFFFDRNEIEVLKRIKCGDKYNRYEFLSLKEAINIIARLGGFIQGKNRVAGVQVMWRGLRRLEDIALGVSLINGDFPRQNFKCSQVNSG